MQSIGERRYLSEKSIFLALYIYIYVFSVTRRHFIKMSISNHCYCINNSSVFHLFRLIRIILYQLEMLIPALKKQLSVIWKTNCFWYLCLIIVYVSTFSWCLLCLACLSVLYYMCMCDILFICLLLILKYW